MYDPTIGRWLSEDPIGFEGGDANLYRYVGNAPTMYTDPSGLFVMPPIDAPPGWPMGDSSQSKEGDFTSNYLHYLDPFVDHHAVDLGDSCLQWGTRAGQAGAVVGWGGAAAVTATGTGGVVLWGGGTAATVGGAGATGSTAATLPYGGPAGAASYLTMLQMMREAAMRMGDCNMAARIAYTFERTEAKIQQIYPELFK